MRYLISMLLLSAVLTVPTAIASDLFQAKISVPAEVPEGDPIHVGVRGIAQEFGVTGLNVNVGGSTVTVDLDFFACPISCDPQLFDFRTTVDPLPPGSYTVQVVIDGCVLAARTFEVVAAKS